MSSKKTAPAAVPTNARASQPEVTLPGPLSYVPIENLIPYARNARTHSDAQVAQVAASIVEFGWTNPVLVAGRSIVAGHGRVLAARKLGLPLVPTLDLSHLTETQRRAYVLADNQLATKAGWDSELLSLELADLKADGFDLTIAGFDALPGMETVAELPSLRSGEREPFRQVTFTVHDSQWEQIEEALKAAKAAGPFVDSPNENSNGNALSRIAETYLTRGAP